MGQVLFSLLLFTGLVVVDGWSAFGRSADGERLGWMRASAQWDGDGFENPQPLWNDIWGSIFADSVANQAPAAMVPVEWVDGRRFASPPSSGLRVTWLGHSTTLIELGSTRVLTDPVWGERSSPVDWVGPQRWYAPPLRLEDVPPVDVVLISHDHYDHLDQPTIAAIRDWDCLFVAPLGVGAHLEYWGVPPERIVEVDWWDEVSAGGITIHATPARHASGRTLFDQNDTLWAGYAIVSSQYSVYFSGDTGLFPDMKSIGERLGPFDLAMIEVGAYDQAWPDWHSGPEQAVKANEWVRAELLLPIHWGLFDLSNHGWTEPMERVLVEAQRRDVRVVSPRPGGSVEPAKVQGPQRWWPEVEWRSASEYPIVATKVD